MQAFKSFKVTYPKGNSKGGPTPPWRCQSIVHSLDQNLHTKKLKRKKKAPRMECLALDPS